MNGLIEQFSEYLTKVKRGVGKHEELIYKGI